MMAMQVHGWTQARGDFLSPEWENSGKYNIVKLECASSAYLEADRLIATSTFCALSCDAVTGWILMSPAAVVDEMYRVPKVRRSSWHAETGQEACQTFHYASVLACKDNLEVCGYSGCQIASVHAAAIGMHRIAPWSSLPCRYYRLVSEPSSHQSLSLSPSRTSMQSPEWLTHRDYLGRAELFSVPAILFPPGVITRAIKTGQLSPSIISWENRSWNRLYILSYLNCSSGWPQSTLTQPLCVSFPMPANPSLSLFVLLPVINCRMILWSFHSQAYQLPGFGQDLVW